jgi:hypothetical protein
MEMKYRVEAAWTTFHTNFIQLLLAIDQLCNPLMGLIFGVPYAFFFGVAQDVCYADETLSAHAHRAYVRDRWGGRIMRPIIDLLFIWQTPEHIGGMIVASHCHRAYLKELHRIGMALEYRKL